jgi:hypothetical protein
MLWFYRRCVKGWLQMDEFLMNGGANLWPSEVKVGLQENELPVRLFRVNRRNHAFAPGSQKMTCEKEPIRTIRL